MTSYSATQISSLLSVRFVEYTSFNSSVTSWPTVNRALGSASFAIKVGSMRTSLNPVACWSPRPNVEPTRPARYESTCSRATSSSSPRMSSSVRPVTSMAMMSGSGSAGLEVSVVSVSPGVPVTAMVMS